MPGVEDNAQQTFVCTHYTESTVEHAASIILSLESTQHNPIIDSIHLLENCCFEY